MPADDIRIEHIRVKNLLGFAERVIASASPGQFIPISLQRARAHAHNPYADPEDVALLAAIDAEDEVVGYFGILPLILRHGDQLHKVHWFTTWNVSAKICSVLFQAKTPGNLKSIQRENSRTLCLR